jgi:hypothetical protein
MSLETKEKEETTERMFNKLNALNKKNQQFVGLRVDAWFKDTKTGDEVMIDTTGVHPNCESFRQAEVKSTLQNIKDGLNPAWGSNNLRSSLAEQCSKQRKERLLCTRRLWVLQLSKLWMV